MDMHKFDALVTRSKFGKWFISSIFTDYSTVSVFFRAPKINVKEKKLVFGRNSIAAEGIKELVVTATDDVEIELADGKRLFVVFNQGTDGFVRDMKSLGVKCRKEK